MPHTNHGPSILVVDDDEKLCRLIVQYLEKQGFSAEGVSCTKDAEKVLTFHKKDAIILDIMMNDENGLDFLQRMALKNIPPVLLLSAKATAKDRIDGLRLGARDYLVKPFEPQELVLRLNNLITPSPSFSHHKIQDDTLSPTALISLAHFQYDPKKGCLFNEKDPTSCIMLTTSEHILLNTLLDKKGEPCTRGELAKALGYCVSERSIDVQMTRLRKKLGDTSKTPHMIKTIRHVGYVLMA
jgi:two-component system phosphate regulon response regulator OmpR